MGLGQSCLKLMKGQESEPLLTNTEYIDEMDQKIAALNMKMHQLELMCENNRLEAQKYAYQNLKNQALNAMKIMNQRKRTLEQWNGIYLKLVQIRHSMDSLMVTEDLANQFKRANNILNYAIKKLDPNEVEDIMLGTQENIEVMQEVNEILSKPMMQEEVDEEKQYEEICRDYKPTILPKYEEKREKITNKKKVLG